MKILSVDWDFFFPNVAMFDWGHREDPMFLEYLWNLRAGNRHLTKGDYAVDTVRPNEKTVWNFWEKVCIGNPNMLIIADSHMDLYNTLLKMRGLKAEIVNFDAHHDIEYGDKSDKVNCGNWGYHGLKNGSIQSLTIVYPEWRAKEPETKPDIDSKLLKKVKMTHDWIAGKYDIVFICRSSAWTPTWCDRDWLNFIWYWKTRRFLWESKISCEFALKERHPNLEEAYESKKQWVWQLEKMNLDNTKEKIENGKR
jgi:hypothetical protein